MPKCNKVINQKLNNAQDLIDHKTPHTKWLNQEFLCEITTIISLINVYISLLISRQREAYQVLQMFISMACLS